MIQPKSVRLLTSKQKNLKLVPGVRTEQFIEVYMLYEVWKQILIWQSYRKNKMGQIYLYIKIK